MSKVMKNVMYSPITSVSVLLRTRVLTPVQLVQSSLKVINATNPRLNAFISVSSQQDAFNHARESEERIRTNKARSKLEGIPIAIKDNFTTKYFFPTTGGSRMLSNYKAPFDCTVVEKLVSECGAILIGKTNLDEFAMGSGTTDSAFGPTINPWKSGLPFTKSLINDAEKIPENYSLTSGSMKSLAKDDNSISVSRNGNSINVSRNDVSVNVSRSDGNKIVGAKNGLGRNGTSGENGLKSSKFRGNGDGINSGLNDHGYDRYPRKQSRKEALADSSVQEKSRSNLDTFKKSLDTLLTSGHGSQSGPVQLNGTSSSSFSSSFSSSSSSSSSLSSSSFVSFAKSSASSFVAKDGDGNSKRSASRHEKHISNETSNEEGMRKSPSCGLPSINHAAKIIHSTHVAISNELKEETGTPITSTQSFPSSQTMSSEEVERNKESKYKNHTNESEIIGKRNEVINIQETDALINNQETDALINNQETDEVVSDWFIAGGSSGGSAVAVATGSVFAAIGSDTGGSTRHPASLVGVLGFKPTYGLISRHGLIALTHSMDTVGIMTRYASDAALMLESLVGHDEKDSTSVINGMERLISKSGNFDPNMDLNGLKIGIPIEYEQELIASLNEGDNDESGQEMLTLWRKTIQLFEKKGAVIKKINLPHSKYVGATYLVLNSTEVSSNFSCYDGIEFGYRANDPVDEDGQLVPFKTAAQLFSASRNSAFGSNVKSRILAGNYFLLTPNQESYLHHAMKVRRLIFQDFQFVFKGLRGEKMREKMREKMEENMRENMKEKTNEKMTFRDGKNANHLRVNCSGKTSNYHDENSMTMNRKSDCGETNDTTNYDTNYDTNHDTNHGSRNENATNYGHQEDDSIVVDFILTPATLRSAVTISEWRKRKDNQQQAIKEDCLLTGANLAGLPAVTFPAGLSSQGLPLSLQLISDHFTDFKLLSVTQTIQNLLQFPFLEYNGK